MVWKITPLFAEWIASPDCVLARLGILAPESVVLELGCGVSGLVGLALSPTVGQYILTDQDYVMKLLQHNIVQNSPPPRKPVSHVQRQLRAAVLDWELHSISLELLGLRRTPTAEAQLDVVLACDCIYNESLIEPLVSTCVDACRLGRDHNAPRRRPTVCVVAQQLRSADIFEAWLMRFSRDFRLWRVSDTHLPESLREGSGHTIHVGVLREEPS